LVINVQDDKSAVVKRLLKEMGVTIQNKAKVRQLAEKINAAIKPGPKPDMDAIVAEVKKLRSGR
jgi:hypothetical protein